MAEAGSKKNPYGVDNDPVRGAVNPLQSPPLKGPNSLKKKQMKSISDAYNEPDPVGDAVRDLWKKVRGK